MGALKRTLTFFAIAGLLTGVALVMTSREPQGEASPKPGASPATVPPSEREAPRVIVAGGGPVPELNQVSIEQDLALAQRTFGPETLLLFAGGAGSQSVQVLDPRPRGDSLLRELGDLFAPRGGRSAHYRLTTLAPDGPATAEATLRELERALETTGRPPLLYLAGHGDKGLPRRNGAVLMWGGGAIEVADLSDVLDSGPPERRARVVVTSCYSGAFAEIAFADADPSKGPAKTDRCGLFATTWDQEASGCDPDPNRRSQEGYGIHFLHALKGLDRDGRPLPKTALDLDGDGRISLAEAHARTRVASASFGVPTSTSERWLRTVAPDSGPEAPLALPEEDAVVRVLGAGLDLVGREGEAKERLAEVERALTVATKRYEEAERAESAAFDVVSAELLSRWPVLDDPWHPDFQATITRQGPKIRAALDRSPAYAKLQQAGEAMDRASARVDALRLKATPLERLARAVDNRVLAARLNAHGGPDLEQYLRLLRCERSVP